MGREIKLLFRVVMVVLTCNLTAVSFAASSDSVDFGGSLRLRWENKVDYNFADAKQDFSLYQLRLNMKWKASEKNSLFIELQDSRVYGENINDIPSINENARNQPFADKLDFHQAYFDFTNKKGRFRIGRQKFNLADQRLVASLEWVNTARVHDGIRMTLGNKNKRQYDFFASSLVSIDPAELNDQSFANNRSFDSQFHGIYVSDKESISGSTLQYWWFWRKNDRGSFDDSTHTLGGRYIHQFEDWKFEFQSSLQTGTFSGLDHNASSLHTEISRPAIGGNIGFAYNYASGDEDPNDNKHGTFDNLYPLNHAYYGYMDLFSLQNVHNLEAVYKTKVFSKSALRIAYQGFWLVDINDSWYNAGLKGNTARRANAISNGADSYIGSEIDVTLKTLFMAKKLVIIAGYSYLFTGDYITDTGSNDNNASFAFLLAKYSF